MERPTHIETLDLLEQVVEAVDDPVVVRLARVLGPGGLAATLLANWPEVSRAKVLVVDAGRVSLGSEDVAALSRAAARGVRVVVAGAGGPLGFAPMLVLHEPDFHRAAVASIYALGSGQTAILLSPEPPGSPSLRGLVRHAMRWRASWREVEGGEFTSGPE